MLVSNNVKYAASGNRKKNSNHQVKCPRPGLATVHMRTHTSKGRQRCSDLDLTTTFRENNTAWEQNGELQDGAGGSAVCRQKGRGSREHWEETLTFIAHRKRHDKQVPAQTCWHLGSQNESPQHSDSKETIHAWNFPKHLAPWYL